MSNGAPSSGNKDDKTLEYFMIKILHYQNQLTYYLYMNNRTSSIQRRNWSFLTTTEFPALIVILANIYFLITNPSYEVWLFIIIIIAALGIPLLIYFFYIRKRNRKDENVMRLTESLINIEYLMEQINLIKNFKISEKLVDSVEHKIGVIEYYVTKTLKKVWDGVGFKNLSKSQIQDFLDETNYDAEEFYLRLEQMLEILKYKYNIKENLENSESYKILKEIKGILDKKFNLKRESVNKNATR